MDVDTTPDKKMTSPRQTYSLGMAARDLPPSPSTISSQQSYQTPVLKGVLIYRIPETPAGQNSPISSILPQYDMLDDSPQLKISEGLVVNVTASNPEPIRLSTVLDDPAHAQHLLIIVEPDVHCTVIDDQRSKPSTRYSSHHCEVLAKEGATINLISLKRLDAVTFQTCRRVGIAERNARITWQSFELGQGQTHSRTHLRLAGEGAQAIVLSSFIGKGKGHSDRKTLISHDVGHSKSLIKSRHLLLDQSSAIHRGFIDIKAGQRGCSGHQQDDTLLGSDEARIDAIPTLEIANQEVQCTHAATMRTIDDEDLFYLMSRGISLAESRRSLFEAFLMPLLDALPPEAEDIKQSLLDQLSKEVQNV